MGAQHTPGPWEASQNAYGAWFVYGGEERSNGITKYRDLISGGNNHNTLIEANARLIAAAPELLAALVGIVAHWEACEQGPGHDHQVPGIWDSDNHPGLAGTRCEWCEQWSNARAAIAKARGETQ